MRFHAPMANILHAIRTASHGIRLREIGEELILQLVGQEVQGEWRSRLGGNNSNYLALDNGQTYYLRGEPSLGIVEARLRPRGPAFCTMRNSHPEDAEFFVSSYCH